MDNGIVEKARSIEVVTDEIKSLVSSAQSVMLGYAVEIGRRLVEAKDLLPHGEWGKWLREKVEFSQSSANNFMKLLKNTETDSLHCSELPFQIRKRLGI